MTALIVLWQLWKDYNKVKTDYDIPTQTCVLAHVTTQMEAIKRGAKVDLIFQSIAGSEKGNEAFGIKWNYDRRS